MRIVITGNIGSGKTLFCSMLRKRLHGHSFFSVDDLFRNAYLEADNAFKTGLRKLLGTDIRSDVARLVFGNDDIRHKVADLAIESFRTRIDSIFEPENVIIEFPLFHEYPLWKDVTELTISVGAPDDIRLARIMKRDTISENEAKSRMSAQMPSAQKAELSDIHIDTDCEPKVLESVADIIAGNIALVESRLLCKDLLGNSSVMDSIQSMHTGGNRHYHTMTHIFDLLEHLHKFKDHPYADAMTLSAMFHDSVYETTVESYPLNEIASADRMLSTLFDTCGQNWIDDNIKQIGVAREIILSTKKHEPTEAFGDGNPEALEACRLFLDADMSILGADGDKYEQYDEKICLEWGQDPKNPSKDFSAGRHSVLQNILDKKRIFLTEQFSHMETAARKNLNTSIEQYAKNQ